MALIKCPECGAVISSTCEACPKCGYIFNDESKSRAIFEASKNPPVMDESITKGDIKNEVKNTMNEVKAVEENEGTTGGGFALGFLLGLIGLVIGLCCKPKTRSGALVGFIVQAIIGLTIMLVQYSM